MPKTQPTPPDQTNQRFSQPFQPSKLKRRKPRMAKYSVRFLIEKSVRMLGNEPQRIQKSPVEEEPAIVMAKMTIQGQRYIGRWFGRHFDVKWYPSSSNRLNSGMGRKVHHGKSSCDPAELRHSPMTSVASTKI